MILRDDPVYLSCAWCSPLFINTAASILHLLRLRHTVVLVVDSPCSDILLHDLETSLNNLYDNHNNEEHIHLHPLRVNATRFHQAANRDEFYDFLVEGQSSFLMLLPVDFHQYVFKMAHYFNLLGPFRRWIIPNFNTSLYDDHENVPNQILTFQLDREVNHEVIDLKDVALEMTKVHHLHW